MTRPLDPIADAALDHPRMAVAILAAALAAALAFGAASLAATVRAQTLAEAGADALATVARLAPLQSGYVDQSQAWVAGQDAEPEAEPVTPDAVTWPAWMPATVTRWGDMFITAGEAHGVDPVLLAIVALVESGGDPMASSGVAFGVMQIHPPSHPTFDASRADDPAYSIDFGAYVMADNMAACAVPGDAPEYVETIRRAASRYNGGACTAYQVKRETAAHARWTAGMWTERHDATSPTYDAWMAAGGRRLVVAAGGE